MKQGLSDGHDSLEIPEENTGITGLDIRELESHSPKCRTMQLDRHEVAHSVKSRESRVYVKPTPFPIPLNQRNRIPRNIAVCVFEKFYNHLTHRHGRGEGGIISNDTCSSFVRLLGSLRERGFSLSVYRTEL